MRTVNGSFCHVAASRARQFENSSSFKNQAEWNQPVFLLLVFLFLVPNAVVLEGTRSKNYVRKQSVNMSLHALSSIDFFPFDADDCQANTTIIMLLLWLTWLLEQKLNACTLPIIWKQNKNFTVFWFSSSNFSSLFCWLKMSSDFALVSSSSPGWWTFTRSTLLSPMLRSC